MYALFNRPPIRNVAAISFPELAYLRRAYQDVIKDVLEHYHFYPKRVDGDHRLGALLTHLPRRWDLDDTRYLHFVDNASEGLSRTYQFTSPTHRGKLHERGLTLGKDCYEAVIDHYNGPPRDIGTVGAWRYWRPLNYLYHTRTDLRLPISNNLQQGKGYGVITIDIPLLALQYRYWLKTQKRGDREEIAQQPESVFRFLGSYALPNMVTSYLDIAIFNRLTRLANGLPLHSFPSPHPFYVMDLSNRIDDLCQKVIKTNDQRRGDVQVFVGNTPMIVQPTLQQVMQLPSMPINRNNEWALLFARLPYLKYITTHGIVEGQGDRRMTNDIYETLFESGVDQLLSGIGSSTSTNEIKGMLENIRTQLKEKGFGWK